MPRRDAYLTDDDDDTPRRAAASGGGTPGWVWVAVGGVALAVAVVGGLWFARSSQREAVMRQEVARANMMRTEVQQTRPRMMEAEHAPGGMAGPGGQAAVVPLAQIAVAFKTNRLAAEGRYTNRPVSVRFEVTTGGVRANGDAWAGTSADLGTGAPAAAEPNVIFRLAGGPVEVGTTVVVEGRCAGLLPDPRGGETLTFTDCQVVRE